MVADERLRLKWSRRPEREDCCGSGSFSSGFVHINFSLMNNAVECDARLASQISEIRCRFENVAHTHCLQRLQNKKTP